MILWLTFPELEEEKKNFLLDKTVWLTVQFIVPLLGFIAGGVILLTTLALQHRDVSYKAYNPTYNRSFQSPLVVKAPDEQLRSSPQVREVLNPQKLQQQGTVAYSIVAGFVLILGGFVSWYLWKVLFWAILRARHPVTYALMESSSVSVES